jgi:ketosteroid isomerase-like protein
MSDLGGRDLVERFWRALERKDFDEATTMLHEEFVEDWPQSKERIHGPEDWRSMATHHPTFPRITLTRLTGGDGFWAAEAEFVYPGSDDRWSVCALCELRDGRIVHITEYFGAAFDAASWRADWVERT